MQESVKYKQPLKSVYIIGKNIIMHNATKQFFAKDDCMILGDGTTDIHRINLSPLIGRIDKNTIINIDAHGNVIEETHYIDSNTTKDFLKKLDSLSYGTAKNIVLLSCLCGAAAKDVQELSEGSCILSLGTESITFDANTIYSMIGINKALIELKNVCNQTILEEIKRRLPYYLSKQGLTIGISIKNIEHPYNNHYIKHTIRAPATIPLHDETVRKYLSHCISQINETFRIQGQDTETIIFSDEDIKHWRKLYAITFLTALIDEDPSQLTEFLRASETNKKLNTFVNAQILDFPTYLTVCTFYNQTECVKMLLQHGADLNALFNNGKTPLILAAHKGFKEIAKLLIDNGANLDLYDEDGNTALIIAVHNSFTEIVKLLIDNGANLNLHDTDGKTALMISSHIGSTEITELLINNGANLDLCDEDGNTALTISLKNNFIKITELLINKTIEQNKQKSPNKDQNTTYIEKIKRNDTLNIMK